MTKTPGSWQFPGSRWWKFDFHTHTPASSDTGDWKRAIGTADEVTPERWLLRYMAAGIDCVAVTDHNSGAWIDCLKQAYARMHKQNVAGFRELHLFPGVEISVHGGFHLLAVLDTSATTSDIDTLLGAVDYAGTKGDSNGETRKGAAEVVEAVLKVGLAIPAHADGAKGLLEVEPGTTKCRRSPQSVRQLMDAEGVLAMEWCNSASPAPAVFYEQRPRWARVLGSDSHSFQGDKVPGSHFTWIKMASPSLEGLRLALLDGNGVSVRRSDEGHFDPWKTPEHFVTRIEISDARVMGNGKPEELKLTPFYNALIGGRGTGKSTIVHSLRMAYRRDDEVRRLSAEAEPRRQFERFNVVAAGRNSEGALRDGTEIRIELMREGVPHLLRWRADGQGQVVEVKPEPDSPWQASPSQTVSAERFPIRLFSQGQIAALAGTNRQALLDIIDEAAAVMPLRRALDEHKRTDMALRARLRELDGKLAGRLELERKLADLSRKLETFAQSGHADILRAHQLAARQQHEVDHLIEQWAAHSARAETLAQDFVFDDWPAGLFEASDDADVLAWRAAADAGLRSARKALLEVAHQLTQGAKAASADVRFRQWQSRTAAARSAYESLKKTLAAQGVDDPQAFGRLAQERQQIESQIKALRQLQRDRDQLDANIRNQWERVLDARRAITSARSAFLRDKLQDNPMVRMEIEPFGSDGQVIARGLREVLEVTDERFESDFQSIVLRADMLGAGAHALDEQMRERLTELGAAKERMLSLDASLGGKFRNYLQRKFEKPEFADHLRCWFPEDDLRIEYSRKANGLDFVSIDQGASPGQRAAALLAFLLAFGDEPLVLDQPEDDLDNHLIYELIVRQIRQNKLRRQLIVVTHNSNVVVNGDAEMVHAFDFVGGQCRVSQRGALQERAVRDEVCQVMEGGRDAFEQRWARLGREI
jgi:energy-coupling factor transporter ATP-binding protein EcfA2